MTQPKKQLELKGSTPLDFFQALIDFIYDPHYAKHLRKIGARYDRDKFPEDFNLMPFIIDALIFETYVNRKTPLDDFLSHYKPQLSKVQYQTFLGFKQSYLGCFEVKDRKKPELILLRDLLDDEIYKVLDSEAFKFLMPGVKVICRLLPFQGTHVLTGSCAILNLEDPKEALALTREIKLPQLQISEAPKSTD